MKACGATKREEAEALIKAELRNALLRGAEVQKHSFSSRLRQKLKPMLMLFSWRQSY